MRKLSVAKFGGSLLDPEGKTILMILKRIKELIEFGRNIRVRKRGVL